jgi:hypothetical protein
MFAASWSSEPQLGLELRVAQAITTVAHHPPEYRARE